MTEQKIYDREGHAHFVTYSCYKRRRRLNGHPAKRIVIGVLGSELTKQCGKCAGFVVMPDHVHAILWFSETNRLSQFMKTWKQRASFQIKRIPQDARIPSLGNIPFTDPVWQPRYYSYNIYSENKLHEKLEYIHNNPVRAGLADSPEDWPFSSARYYLTRKPVGAPIHPIP